LHNIAKSYFAYVCSVHVTGAFRESNLLARAQAIKTLKKLNKTKIKNYLKLALQLQLVLSENQATFSN